MNKDKNKELEAILKELNKNIKDNPKSAEGKNINGKSIKNEKKTEDRSKNKTEDRSKNKTEDKTKSKASNKVYSKKKKNSHNKKNKKVKRYTDIIDVIQKDYIPNKSTDKKDTEKVKGKDSKRSEEETDSVKKDIVSESKKKDDISQSSEQRIEKPHVENETVTVEIPLSKKNVRPSRYKRHHMTKREKFTALFGLVVTVFVIIGVFSTVMGTVKLTKELVNSTAQKEEFARIVFPLVIVDVPEFDDPTSLDNSAIISSAIWSFIIDDNDKSQYSKDNVGEMKVPDVDIEPYIRRLYGNEVEIEHQLVNDTSVQMLYDADDKYYLIESTPQFLPYTPRVDKITREKDIYTLDVSYLLPDAMWNLDKSHKKATVDKIMQYRLQKNNTGYQILSVKLIDVISHSNDPDGSSYPEDNEDESSGDSSRLAIS